MSGLVRLAVTLICYISYRNGYVGLTRLSLLYPYFSLDVRLKCLIRLRFLFSLERGTDSWKFDIIRGNRNRDSEIDLPCL